MYGKIIAIALTLIIVSLAIFYIVRHKRRGGGCIGCPSASSCPGRCSCNKKK